MKKNTVLILGFVMLPMLYGCNDSIIQNDDILDSGEDIIIIPEFEDEIASRVGAVIFPATTEFYFSAYQGTISKGKNIRCYLEDGTWKKSKAVTWPTGNKTISFWGLSQPFTNGDGISECTLTSKTQTFKYTLDPANVKDLKFASLLNTTKEKSDGGKIILGFVHGLAYPYFTCAQGISDAVISIKEVIFHNLQTAATFVYDKSINSYGKWTLTKDTYGTFTQVQENAITLDPTKTVDLTDAWTLMPQKPTKWATTASKPVPITTADEKHHCYVELKCKIIKDGGIYAWGHASGENEFESLYVPFNTSFSTRGYKKGIKLTLTATGVYNADGTVFTPRAELMNAPWVTEDIIVEPWEELPEEDLEFGAKQSFAIED